MARIVYVLANPVMPELVKIGFTSRKEVAKRTAELDRQTGVPLPFQCFYAGEMVDKANDLEKPIQKTFAKDCVSTERNSSALIQTRQFRRWS